MKTDKRALIAVFGEALARRFKRIGVYACMLAASVMFCSFSVNAETTYRISDGDDTFVISSKEDSAESAVAEAGIVMRDKDQIIVTEYGDGGYAEVEVVRAKSVTVKRGGEIRTVRTLCGTVGELLESLGVEMTPAIEISCDRETEIFDGMGIRIFDVEYVEETVMEPVAPHPMYVYDSSMAEDETALIIEGRDGAKKVTSMVKYVDGVAREREVIAESVVENPVDPLYSTGDKSIATLSEVDAENKTLKATNGSEYAYKRQLNMIATAYTHSGNLTATGREARVGIVAADTSVLPFGTLVYITGADGSWTYGYALVGDTGVKNNILDLFMDTYDECIQHGARKALVYVVDTDK